jgi:hypothetical protein
MKKLSFLLVLCGVLLISLPVYAQDFVGIISNIGKSRSSEALSTMSAFKASLAGCMAVHEGNESYCSSLELPTSPNFKYEFVTPPLDGSKVWSLKASGLGQNNLTESDAIFLMSDNQGGITCRGQGQLANVCP